MPLATMGSTGFCQPKVGWCLGGLMFVYWVPQVHYLRNVLLFVPCFKSFWLFFVVDRQSPAADHSWLRSSNLRIEPSHSHLRRLGRVSGFHLWVPGRNGAKGRDREGLSLSQLLWKRLMPLWKDLLTKFPVELVASQVSKLTFQYKRPGLAFGGVPSLPILFWVWSLEREKYVCNPPVWESPYESQSKSVYIYIYTQYIPWKIREAVVALRKQTMQLKR